MCVFVCARLVCLCLERESVLSVLSVNVLTGSVCVIGALSVCV